MSNELFKKIADVIIITILVSGVIITVIAIMSFLFPGQNSMFFRPEMKFRYRLLWLMFNIFSVTIAAGASIAFILFVTKRLRDSNKD